MKIKSIIAAVAMMLPVAVFAQYPMKIAEVPVASGFSSDYDATTDTWTLTCETNDGGALMPFFRLNTIEEAVPTEYTALVFEYRSTHDINTILMNMYKVFMGSATRTITVDGSMSATDGWKTFRADLYFAAQGQYGPFPQQGRAVSGPLFQRPPCRRCHTDTQYPL